MADSKTKMNLDMKTGIAILVFIVIALAVLAFVPPPASLTGQNQQAGSAMEPTVLATFTGSLPCADCAGITETLTLTQTSENGGTYVLNDVYAEKGAHTTNGTWTVMQGDATDPQAPVIVLDPKTDHARYYLEKDENTIVPLAPDLTEIDSPFDQSLHRVMATSTNPS